MKKVELVGWSNDNNGNILDKCDSNPILNTVVYDVNFPDDTIREYRTNLIVDNMYSQVYYEDFSHSILSGILDFSKDTTSVQKGDQSIIINSGQHLMRKSTSVWNLLITWKDGSKKWIPLSVMKEYNPIEVAEITTPHGISEEPAFAWWVPYTLKKRYKLISDVNARLKLTTHKYGVAVPRSVEEAYFLDTKNGNTL